MQSSTSVDSWGDNNKRHWYNNWSTTVPYLNILYVFIDRTLVYHCVQKKVPAHLIQTHFNTDVEKTITPSPWSHTFPLTLPATPLWRFGRCTTNILVQHSQRRKATVTKQQSLGGGQSYRHGDPHSFGLPFFGRSRPGRALTAGERRHRHSTSINHTASATLDTFTPPRHPRRPGVWLLLAEVHVMRAQCCKEVYNYWSKDMTNVKATMDGKKGFLNLGFKIFFCFVLFYTKCFQK